MEIRQNGHAMHIYGIRLPAYSLLAYQQPTAKKNARYVWVEDVRTCAYTQFRIKELDCAKCEVHSYIVDVSKSATARAFAKFADNLPLSCIHAPVWDNNKDICECGPKDRRPQTFDARRMKPQNSRTMTDRSAVDGVKVGPVRYREEGYYSAILKNGR